MEARASVSRDALHLRDEAGPPLSAEAPKSVSRASGALHLSQPWKTALRCQCGSSSSLSTGQLEPSMGFNPAAPKAPLDLRPPDQPVTDAYDPCLKCFGLVPDPVTSWFAS